MKPLIAALVFILVLLQYKLWFGEGGVTQYWRLRHTTTEQLAQNDRLKKRNEQLKAEIKDLKQGEEAIEERARNDLGMVKKDETYYQVVDK